MGVKLLVCIKSQFDTIGPNPVLGFVCIFGQNFAKLSGFPWGFLAQVARLQLEARSGSVSSSDPEGWSATERGNKKDALSIRFNPLKTGVILRTQTIPGIPAKKTGSNPSIGGSLVILRVVDLANFGIVP